MQAADSTKLQLKTPNADPIATLMIGEGWWRGVPSLVGVEVNGAADYIQVRVCATTYM